MLAAAGILFEDILGHIGAGGPAARTPWFNAGKFEYFAPASTLTIIQFFLFAWVEIRRYQDMKNPCLKHVSSNSKPDVSLLTPAFNVCSANQDPIFSSYKLPDGNEPGEKCCDL